MIVLWITKTFTKKISLCGCV